MSLGCLILFNDGNGKCKCFGGVCGSSTAIFLSSLPNDLLYLVTDTLFYQKSNGKDGGADIAGVFSTLR